ncbi:MAG: protein kinase [Gemmatimonadota bacterium]|nr:protein kinase [Gemmatimonadota bacterium]
MICPRCSVADLPDDAHQCPLCGFSPSANVIVDQRAIDDVFDGVQQALKDRFRLQSLIRLGERSFVYAAQERAQDRFVALKVIPVAGLVDHELAKQFERKGKLAQSLSHSHIVTVYDFGVTRTFVWYSMEYIKGQSLAEVLRTAGPMELDTCLRLAEQVASALDYAHRREIVHGNLKPSNIFVDEQRWVRVADFAVLDAFGRPAAPQPGAPIIHMPEYLAPEQFYARSAGASADQYALAVVLFQCLTGSPPFVGDSFEEVARQHASEPPPRLSQIRADLPVSLMETIQRALSKVPAGRFPTVLDFTAALTRGFATSEGRAAAALVQMPATQSEPSELPVLTIEAERGPFPVGRLFFGAIVVLALTVAAIAVASPQLVRDVIGRAQAAVAAFGAGQSDEPAPLKWETLDPIDPVRRAPVTEVPQTTPTVETQRPAETTTQQPPTLAAQPPVSPPQQTVAPQPGRLLVNARPWGQLYVDGQLIGNTPLSDVRVSPGTHRVRIVRDGYVPFERTIRIAPGEVVRLTNIVLESREQ